MQSRPVTQRTTRESVDSVIIHREQPPRSPAGPFREPLEGKAEDAFLTAVRTEEAKSVEDLMSLEFGEDDVKLAMRWKAHTDGIN